MPQAEVEAAARAVAEAASIRRRAYQYALQAARGIAASAEAARSLSAIVIGPVERLRVAWTLASLPTVLLAASNPPALAFKLASTFYTLARSGTTVNALRDAARTLSLLLQELEYLG